VNCLVCEEKKPFVSCLPAHQNVRWSRPTCEAHASGNAAYQSSRIQG